MDLQQTIKQVGLNENQTNVYFAALELGEASMTELAKRAGLKRPTTYLVVDELSSLGLLSETQKGKRRVFSAAHPRRLLQIARFREKQIEESLPELAAIYGAPKEKPKVQMFEGIEGVRLVYKDLLQSLSRKEEALWIGNVGVVEEHFPDILKEYKKIVRSIKNPRIRELNQGDQKGRKWAQEMKKYQGKNHFIRLFPEELKFGFSEQLIIGNKLAIFSLKKNIFVIVIESEEIAKTNRAEFELAWRQGEEI